MRFFACTHARINRFHFCTSWHSFVLQLLLRSLVLCSPMIYVYNRQTEIWAFLQYGKKCVMWSSSFGVNEKRKLVSLISYLIYIFLFEISSPHAIFSRERLTAAGTKNEWYIDTNLQVIMIMKMIRTFRNATISYKDWWDLNWKTSPFLFLKNNIFLFFNCLIQLLRGELYDLSKTAENPHLENYPQKILNEFLGKDSNRSFWRK